MIDWTDEALDRAISQLKALRFSQGMTAREQMKCVLDAAAYTILDGATDEERAIINQFAKAIGERIKSEQQAAE